MKIIIPTENGFSSVYTYDDKLELELHQIIYTKDEKLIIGDDEE